MAGRGPPQCGYSPEWTDDVRETVDSVVSRATRAPLGASPAEAVNPEAGDHVVTTNRRELRAALLAGERIRQRFGYFEQRYGERGRRFCHSDTAWIVTLSGEPPGVAEHQLRWLGALLAARGMPRWLLEELLGAMHAELVAAVPQKRSAYDELPRVAAVFRDERLSRLDRRASSELVQAFERRVGSAAAGLPEAGALMVAAVAEERAGLNRVVDSLMHWLGDPARFPAGWVAAASETVAAARELARG